MKSKETAEGFIPGLRLGSMLFSEAARPIIESVIPADSTSGASILAKESGVLAGISIAGRVFHKIDPAVRFSVTVEDPTNMQVLSNNVVDTSGFTNLDGLGQRLMLTNTVTQLLRVFNADQPASPVPMDAIHYQNQPLVPVMNINRVYVMERLI